MLTITGASARDKHPGRVLPELIKTRPWGSHYRAEGRAREPGRRQRSCWGTQAGTGSRAPMAQGDSVISASVFELSAPARIKQRLESAKGVLWVRECGRRLDTSFILINPHHNKAGIIMPILPMRKRRIRKIKNFPRCHEKVTSINK